MTAAPHAILGFGTITAISFDYGHVLGGLDVEELARRLVDELGAFAGERAGLASSLREALPSGFGAHDEAIGRGEGHEAAWRALMRKLLNECGLDASAATTAVDALWRAQPTRNLWRYIPPEARALLDELTALGVPMVVTSNSEGRAAELLQEVGIAPHFLAILDSGALGFSKPDRRIFDLAARALGAPLSRIVHVGDSESADVVGAKSAGARALRFDGFVRPSSGSATLADGVVDTYEALRNALLDGLGKSREGHDRSRQNL